MEFESYLGSLAGLEVDEASVSVGRAEMALKRAIEEGLRLEEDELELLPRHFRVWYELGGYGGV